MLYRNYICIFAKIYLLMKPFNFLFALFVFTFCNCHPANAQIITTIAGNGIAGFAGDGGPAITAKLNDSRGVVTDTSGNIYFCDLGNHRLRKINAAGIITTIAGISTTGYSGDGGPATLAQLNEPFGIALDGSRNIYFADYGNNVIRKITPSGYIYTVAGNNVAGFSGDGGPATNASLHQPVSVCTDTAGNVYVADRSNNRVRKITPSGTISTFAGNGVGAFLGDGGPATTAELYVPDWLAADKHGNVFIIDEHNYRIRKVDAAGIISTVAGNGSSVTSGDGGPATAAGMLGYTVAVDNSGDIYLGEFGNSLIRKIDASGIINAFTGTGLSGYSGDNCSADSAQIANPYGIGVDTAGNVYFADNSNQRIRKVSKDHKPIFTGGHFQNLVICSLSGADSINALLTISDVDTGQTETWSLLNPPLHGTAVAGYSTLSATGPLFTTGLFYTPATGFIGNDTFKVVVTDCALFTDTTTIFVKLVDCALGVPSIPTTNENTTLHIWPDPNDGRFVVSLSSKTIESARIIITNILGENVQECQTSTNKETTITTELPFGVYFINAVTAHGIWSKKMIISR